ncbi:MAG: lipoprotein [marine bacterium B5-7]|nr:MAG: lipoprotein [marine bacterium B5-7]
MDFAAYRQFTQQQLFEVHGHRLCPWSEETIASLNAPQAWHPDNPNGHGVVLIHGLFESPYHMRAIGDWFCQQGYLVHSVLLPGHGTQPDDLIDMEYDAWIEASQFVIDLTQAQVDQLIVCGHSTGGLLAIYHALRNPSIDRLVLSAPCLKVASRFAGLAPMMQGLSELFPRLQWLSRKEENDVTKYQSVATNAVVQLQHLMKIVSSDLQHATREWPMMVLASAQDTTVSSAAVLDFFQQFADDNSRLLYYSKHLTHLLHDTRIHVVQSTGTVHPSLLRSPDDPHYGADGEMPEYNPKFSHLTAALQDFLTR